MVGTRLRKRGRSERRALFRTPNHDAGLSQESAPKAFLSRLHSSSVRYTQGPYVGVEPEDVMTFTPNICLAAVYQIPQVSLTDVLNINTVYPVRLGHHREGPVPAMFSEALKRNGNSRTCNENPTCTIASLSVLSFKQVYR
ncbi:hypothetical protein Bbelb_128240 [Branchiostoma belcheri]|nr:hypothetical protein Bbelb_128240 [Branchiostoma belcheri]